MGLRLSFVNTTFDCIKYVYCRFRIYLYFIVFYQVKDGFWRMRIFYCFDRQIVSTHIVFFLMTLHRNKTASV